MTRLFAAAILLALVTGCAGLAPTVPGSAPPDPQAGYVAGLFNRQGMSFAMVLRAVDGGGSYILPMGEDTRWPGDLERSSVAVAVKPGTYTVAEWFTYGTVNKEVISRRPNTIAALQAPFVVKAGAVLHLGEISVASLPVPGPNGYTAGIELRVSPRATPWREVRGAFERAYPMLASQPASCILCGAGP
ncbi:hypothetical protein LQ564_22510 [Massilia sp. G4R7]|uniref:DUF2846 domain-containing protein n=1 Tax=Massilia phyllostachyos TaxID=2898585 RepID=A0ABS8QC19_9BURK|nr:hypothetical protein [Massilia phyllostachyos]MCD2519078.1 hypothetical protein [Massilia phyllostachyos]